MRKIEVNLLLALAILGLALCPAMSKAQDSLEAVSTETANYVPRACKYHFIADICPGSMVGANINLDHNTVICNYAHYSAYQSHNLLFKERVAIGLGIGVEYSPLWGDANNLDFPFFINFRYYFRNPDPKQTILRPFINASVGTVVNTVIGTEIFDNTTIFRVGSAGFFGTVGGGIQIRRLQVHAGIQLYTKKSFQIDSYREWDNSVDKRGILYLKDTGHTLSIDFVVRAGFNF